MLKPRNQTRNNTRLFRQIATVAHTNHKLESSTKPQLFSGSAKATDLLLLHLSIALPFLSLDLVHQSTSHQNISMILYLVMAVV
jgi:hypothetical protein